MIKHCIKKTQKPCWPSLLFTPWMQGLVTGEEEDIKLSRTDLHSAKYHLVAADFTDLNSLESKLSESDVNFTCPTLILAECALVYVDMNKSNNMLGWFANKFTSCSFVNYEQLNMNDRLVFSDAKYKKFNRICSGLVKLCWTIWCPEVVYWPEQGRVKIRILKYKDSHKMDGTMPSVGTWMKYVNLSFNVSIEYLVSRFILFYLREMYLE